MTRFRTHLDDMPAAGYAYSAVATNRTRAFNSLLFGHIANYQSRGSFNAPEQLGFEAADDGYRALLGPGLGETDIDTCVPSTTLAAVMLRWMLVFEERDTDTIWLLKTAPRRFYPGASGSTPPGSSRQPVGSFLSVRQAATRFGWVSFAVDSVPGGPSVSAIPHLRLVANVTLVLHGRGHVTKGSGLAVALRLRDPTGQRVPRSAAIAGTAAGVAAVTDVDSVGESVTVEVSRAGVHTPAESSRTVSQTVSFSLTVVLR